MSHVVSAGPSPSALRRGCSIRAAIVGALQSDRVSYERAHMLAGQVMAEAAIAPDPFHDTTPNHTPELSDAQRTKLEKLLQGMGLNDLNVRRVLDQIDSAVGVQRLSEALNENARSGGMLDENSAQSGGIGASSTRGGEHFISERVDAQLRRLAQGADPDVVGICGRAEQTAGRAPAPPAAPPAPARRTLDLRLHSGRNVTERALSLVRANNPRLDFDSAWVEACDLLRRARQDGTEILL